MIKFSKNREVDSRYLNVPVKYISGIKGADTMSNSKPDIEGGYKRYVEFCKTCGDSEDEIISLKEFTESVKDGWGSVDCLPPRNDKTFCILELTKRWALCGWRNNEKYSVGIPFKCRVIKKNGNIGIVYKDKFYPINDPYGWVF